MATLNNTNDDAPMIDLMEAVSDAEAVYRAAVEEGKQIVAQVSNRQWRLGDLADTVVTVYNENKLEQFAEDINFDGVYTTLERYRTVCRAFPKSRGRPRYFASAQVLAPHPERFAIVEWYPEISEREARAKMNAWRDEQDQQEAAPTPTEAGQSQEQEENKQEPQQAPASPTEPPPRQEPSNTPEQPEITPASPEAVAALQAEFPNLPDFLERTGSWLGQQQSPPTGPDSDRRTQMTRSLPEYYRLAQDILSNGRLDSPVPEANEAVLREWVQANPGMMDRILESAAVWWFTVTYLASLRTQSAPPLAAE
jgi:hypothetical protein